MAPLARKPVDLIVGKDIAPNTRAYLHFQLLFNEPLLIVTGVQNLWSRRRKITVADLGQETWILPEPNTEVGTLIAEVFDASGLEAPRAAAIGSSVEMMWALLATGNYLAILPQSILRLSRQRALVKILPVNGLCLGWHECGTMWAPKTSPERTGAPKQRPNASDTLRIPSR